MNANGYKQAKEFTPNMWTEAEGKLSGDQSRVFKAFFDHLYVRKTYFS